eukprot:scaffold9325_cov73-Cyclotella_meneghiniana.AAC.1
MIIRQSCIQVPYNPKTAKHAIVPDIHAIDFPTSRIVANDSGAKSTAEAFYEGRTFTACNSWYNFNNTTANLADHRTKSSVSEYKSRFQNLDKHQAPHPRCQMLSKMIIVEFSGGIT